MPHLIAYALVYTLSVWAIATAAKLLIYLATSVDDFFDLVRAAAAHSAVAMWLPLATLLIGTHNAGESALGILLLANTSRILIARRAPQTRRRPEGQNARANPILFIGGALLFQVGFCAWLWGNPVASAVACALTACLWTSAYVNSGAGRPPAAVTRTRILLSTVAILLLATGLTATRLRLDEKTAESPSFLKTSRAVAARLADTRKAGAAGAPNKSQVTRLTATMVGAGVPGVILRPKPTAKQRVAFVTRAVRFSLVSPVTFHFTGEYRLFPASSRIAPADSAVGAGTPLEQVYATVGGTLVATEAYQKLDPPLDLTACAKIRLTVRNEEGAPIGAELRLITNSGAKSLGTEIFGLPPIPEETLEFPLPASRDLATTTALRVLFRRVPVETSRSTRVEITGFTFLPR